MNTRFIISYRELRVYQAAFDAAIQVFEVSQAFPLEERELLTMPLLRASRLVCIYVSQAWQKRRYQSAFVARLNQAEAEAAATQVWIEFAHCAATWMQKTDRNCITTTGKCWLIYLA